jgi:2-dehydropantoate 2-reductase
LMNASGLKAEALRDARPAQWSKLIFNASVNSVSALTELPHSPHFAAETRFSDLGHLLHRLDRRRQEQWPRRLASSLHEDPWTMNCIGARTNHPPSMLYDIRHRQSPPRLIFWAALSPARRSELAFAAPLHTALYRLVKAKEASWTWKNENVHEDVAVGGDIERP